MTSDEIWQDFEEAASRPPEDDEDVALVIEMPTQVINRKDLPKNGTIATVLDVQSIILAMPYTNNTVFVLPLTADGGLLRHTMGLEVMAGEEEQGDELAALVAQLAAEYTYQHHGAAFWIVSAGWIAGGCQADDELAPGRYRLDFDEGCLEPWPVDA